MVAPGGLQPADEERDFPVEGSGPCRQEHVASEHAEEDDEDRADEEAREERESDGLDPRDDEVEEARLPTRRGGLLAGQPFHRTPPENDQRRSGLQTPSAARSAATSNRRTSRR